MGKKEDPQLVTVETYLCCDCRYWGNEKSTYADWKLCDMWNSYTSEKGFCMYSHPRFKWEVQDG